MRKEKIAPTEVLLKAMVTYLTDERQRPSGFENITKSELIKFINDNRLLNKLNCETNKDLKSKTLAFAFKMLMAKLGEKIEINEEMVVYKNGIKVYKIDEQSLNLDDIKYLNFDMICNAGNCKTSIKNQKLSDTESTNIDQTSFAV